MYICNVFKYIFSLLTVIFQGVMGLQNDAFCYLLGIKILGPPPLISREKIFGPPAPPPKLQGKKFGPTPFDSMEKIKRPPVNLVSPRHNSIERSRMYYNFFSKQGPISPRNENERDSKKPRVCLATLISTFHVCYFKE